MESVLIQTPFTIQQRTETDYILILDIVIQIILKKLKDKPVQTNI